MLAEPMTESERRRLAAGRSIDINSYTALVRDFEPGMVILTAMTKKGLITSKEVELKLGENIAWSISSETSTLNEGGDDSARSGGSDQR